MIGLRHWLYPRSRGHEDKVTEEVQDVIGGWVAEVIEPSRMMIALDWAPMSALTLRNCHLQSWNVRQHCRRWTVDPHLELWNLFHVMRWGNWRFGISISDFLIYDYIREIGAFILFLLPFESIPFDLFCLVHCKILWDSKQNYSDKKLRSKFWMLSFNQIGMNIFHVSLISQGLHDESMISGRHRASEEKDSNCYCYKWSSHIHDSCGCSCYSFIPHVSSHWRRLW